MTRFTPEKLQKIKVGETQEFQQTQKIQEIYKNIGRAVFLIPHPDDESLGCGGMIQKLLSENVEVKLCFLTSGGASHPNSKKFPREALEILRENEARKACKILGIPTANLVFLRQPDGALSHLNETEETKIISHLTAELNTFSADALFLPWRRDPHPDHLATYEFGMAAMLNYERKILIFEYPIWLWKNSVETDWPFENEITPILLDIHPWKSNKKEAIFAHQSQTTPLIDDDPDGFILTPFLLQPFLESFEYFFISPILEEFSG